MPADYRILADKGLAYVKFWGHASMEEISVCFEQFAQDPENAKAHKHLVDFSGVETYDSDFVKIIAFQAKMVDVFAGDISQWIFTYYAPTAAGREMANYGTRAWSGIDKVVTRMTATESDTLDVLGLPHRSIRELLDGVTPM